MDANFVPLLLAYLREEMGAEALISDWLEERGSDRLLLSPEKVHDHADAFRRFKLALLLLPKKVAEQFACQLAKRGIEKAKSRSFESARMLDLLDVRAKYVSMETQADEYQKAEQEFRRLYKLAQAGRSAGIPFLALLAVKAAFEGDVVLAAERSLGDKVDYQEERRQFNLLIDILEGMIDEM